jgi:hypothetical protein
MDRWRSGRPGPHSGRRRGTAPRPTSRPARPNGRAAAFATKLNDADLRKGDFAQDFLGAVETTGAPLRVPASQPTSALADDASFLPDPYIVLGSRARPPDTDYSISAFVAMSGRCTSDVFTATTIAVAPDPSSHIASIQADDPSSLTRIGRRGFGVSRDRIADGLIGR